MSKTTTTGLTGAAFVILLLTAFMMGANHVAARTAFNHGLDVVTAVTVRSVVTAGVVALILWHQKVAFSVLPQQRKYLAAVGVLIALQSVCLYSAVARLPVALALLAFNTYPLTTALWARILYGHQPERALLWAMPVMMLGLALALDVLGAASGLGAARHWGEIGAGVGFALIASVAFGLALVLTQHETVGVDGRLRTFTSLTTVGVLAALVASTQGGFQWPQAEPGWWGLVLLTLLYGTAFTVMFTVLPKLGVVGNSAIMNVEPIFALVLAWALLGQSIAAMQLVGAAVVVSTVMWLGLRKPKT
jgi:drug/metabolite transporter (DMT)-like permease